MLASDSGPPLQPEGLAKERTTLASDSDREYTEPLLIALLQLAQSEPTGTN